MLVSNLETYGSWNLDLLVVPERSRLYSLEPIAMGTAYVEGLISYICRLAEAHCVSPGILIKQEILPSFRRMYTVGHQKIYQLHDDGDITSVSSLYKPTSTKNPNEYSFLAFQYIEGLKPLVLRQNLQSLILSLCSDGILDTSIELVRDIRAWCPQCFQERFDNKQLVYEPLLWSIAAVTVCPYHYQPLQSRCPSCQRIQRPLTGKMQVARCSQCQAWLNKLGENPSESERLIYSELEWHLWVTQQVIEVLAVTSNLPNKETSAAIAQVLRETRESESKMALDQSTRQMQLKLLETFVSYSQ